MKWHVPTAGPGCIPMKTHSGLSGDQLSRRIAVWRYRTGCLGKRNSVNLSGSCHITRESELVSYVFSVLWNKFGFETNGGKDVPIQMQTGTSSRRRHC